MSLKENCVAVEGMGGEAVFQVFNPLGSTTESGGGVWREAPDLLARSPYRLMERFLMDGLYPSQLKCSHSCGPSYPHASSAPLPTLDSHGLTHMASHVINAACFKAYSHLDLLSIRKVVEWLSAPSQMPGCKPHSLLLSSPVALSNPGVLS